MNRSLVTTRVVVLALGAALALSPAAWAQTKITAGMRGKVVDEKGQPIPAVKVDFEFTGESRQKITKTQLTRQEGRLRPRGPPGWAMEDRVHERGLPVLLDGHVSVRWRLQRDP